MYDSVGELKNVPELPHHFISRSETFTALRDKVLHTDKAAVAVTSIAYNNKVGVQGMGGIGKSVLVAAIARDRAVQEKFVEGIIWITLGQDLTHLLNRQRQLAQALGETTPQFSDIQAGRMQLQGLLTGRACLIILDDVWHREQIHAFNVLGASAQLLLTTRNAELLTGLGAEQYTLELLTLAQAQELLSAWSQRQPLPTIADEIIEECGYLPLAVAMIGAMLRDRSDQEAWEDVLELLQEADLKRIEQAFPDYEYPNLFRALQISVEALETELQQRYYDCALFPEDISIPPAVLQTLWDIKKAQTHSVLNKLEGLSLLRRDEANQFSLHDLQRDYLLCVQGNALQALHQRLLDAYQRLCPTGWAWGPHDGYFFEYLPYHLAQAGQQEVLKQLLTDFAFLRAKVKHVNPYALLADYSWLTVQDSAVEQWQRFIDSQSHLLAQTPELFFQQALNQPTESVMAQAAEQCQDEVRPYLRWLNKSVKWVRSPLLRTLVGHTDSVNSIAVSANNRYVVSGSADKTLKIWELASGQLTQTLEGHSDWVSAVAVSADNRYVVSGSADKTLKIWELASGQLTQTFDGHGNYVSAVAVSADSRYVVSGSADNTLKIWELASGQLTQTFEGHGDGVTTVAVSADNRYVVSGSWDNTVKIWELASGQLTQALEGHGDGVNTVAVSADNRYVVSGSLDKTLKIWELASAQLIQTLEGHSDRVNAVAVGADNHYIVSTSNDKTLRIWELANGQNIATFPTEGYATACAWATNGKIVCGDSLGRLYILQLGGVS